MASCFYEGTVRHRRFTPVRRDFVYRLFLVYVDLAELDSLFGRRGLWSVKWPALARFRREDHLGDPRQPLDAAVRDLVEMQAGVRPTGPVRLLTNFRHFGFGMNPVSLFYCFDRQSSALDWLVAEVNNTPWGEQHCYVLDLRAETTGRSMAGARTARHPKSFHVSPFLGMEMDHCWRLSMPGERLTVHIENHAGEAKLFDATLSLRRTAITPSSRAAMLVRYPMQSLRIFARIYWQAFRLWSLGVPFVPHPASAAIQSLRSTDRFQATDEIEKTLELENVPK